MMRRLNHQLGSHHHVAGTILAAALGVAALLGGGPAQAQSPAFVVDLERGEENGDAFLPARPEHAAPSAPVFEAVEFEGRLFFAAAHPHHGVELFVSDGSAAGTVLAYDVCPGPCDSWPGPFAVFQGDLYFAADNGSNGRELHVLRAGGASSGGAPVLLTDICRGRCSALPAVDVSESRMGILPSPRLVAGPGALFFAAEDGASGHELWATDGRPAGTRRVADLCPGSCSPVPSQLVATSDLLFFEVRSLDHRIRSIARSDGTAAGTFVLGTGREPRSVGDGIVMIGSSEGSLEELWRSDGTPAGTGPVMGDCPGGCRFVDAFLGSLEDRVFFVDSRRNLFSTDGTATGTEIVLVRRVLTEAGAAVLGDELFFFSQFSGFDQPDLWASRGLPGQSRTVFDNVPPPVAMAAAGGQLFFQVRLDTGEWELWSSDGSQRGTAPLRRFTAPLAGFAASGDRLFTSAVEGPAGRELWSSDGSAAGTVPVADIHRGAASSRPRQLRANGDLLAFVAAGSRPGVYLADGGRARLFAPSGGASEPAEIFADGDGFLFCGSRAGRVLPEEPGMWRLDAAGEAHLVVPDVFDCESFAAFGGGLLFGSSTRGAPYAPLGQELWFSDRSAAGTRMVANIGKISGLVGGLPIDPHSYPRDLTALESGVVFAATNYDVTSEIEGGRELWFSDGTEAGTRLLADLWLADSSAPAELTRIGERVVFAATDDRGRELFVTDGTVAGSGRLRDLQTGSASSDPRGFVEFDGALHFFARRGGSDRLWRTDGTVAGTRHIANLAFGGQPSSAGEMVRLGERLVFTVYNVHSGAELWSSDGTARGTRQIVEIAPRQASAAPMELAVIEIDPGVERVVFAATDARHGHEPWISDGTAEGTRLLADLAPGPGSSAPAEFAAIGRFLVWSATTADQGRELWALALDHLR